MPPLRGRGRSNLAWGLVQLPVRKRGEGPSHRMPVLTSLSQELVYGRGEKTAVWSCLKLLWASVVCMRGSVRGFPALRHRFQQQVLSAPQGCSGPGENARGKAGRREAGAEGGFPEPRSLGFPGLGRSCPTGECSGARVRGRMEEGVNG